MCHHLTWWLTWRIRRPSRTTVLDMSVNQTSGRLACELGVLVTSVSRRFTTWYIEFIHSPHHRPYWLQFATPSRISFNLSTWLCKEFRANVNQLRHSQDRGRKSKNLTAALTFWLEHKYRWPSKCAIFPFISHLPGPNTFHLSTISALLMNFFKMLIYVRNIQPCANTYIFHKKWHASVRPQIVSQSTNNPLISKYERANLRR